MKQHRHEPKAFAHYVFDVTVPVDVAVKDLGDGWTRYEFGSFVNKVTVDVPTPMRNGS